MEPTARPIEEAVKDSRHVMPMNPANLQPEGGERVNCQSNQGSKWPRKRKTDSQNRRCNEVAQYDTFVINILKANLHMLQERVLFQLLHVVRAH